MIHCSNFYFFQLSIETLKLFEALLNLSHEPILRNLILRNLDDRAYFVEPTMTNGEASRNETCGFPERGCSDNPNENGNEGVENDKIDPAVKQSKDTFFDKQKIEKLVNGCVNFLILHFSVFYRYARALCEVQFNNFYC